MPLDTYPGLLATLPNYLERADLTPHLPDIVRLAEKRLHRRLNLSDNEVQARLGLAAGRAPLPDDYAAWRSVNAAQGRSLEYLPPHAFIALYGRAHGLSVTGQGDGYDDVAAGASGSHGGRPQAFTILGSIPFDDIDADASVWSAGLDNPFLLIGPAWNGSIGLVYRQGIPPLSVEQPVNRILSGNPDLYLYACLVEAEPFLKNDARMATWKALFEEALGDVERLDRDARWGRARIRTLEPTP